MSKRKLSRQQAGRIEKIPQSGAGKSSLVNVLLPEPLLADDNQLYEALALSKGLNILGLREKKPAPEEEDAGES